jgi:hypothetical protein
MSALSGVAGAALLVLGLAACGDESRTAPAARTWGDCDGRAFAKADGQLARVDLEGKDGPVVVKLVTGDGPCDGGLVAQYDDEGVAGHDVSRLDLDPETAQVVTLDDGQTLLRIDGEGHPRGGFQPHLFAVSDGMAEVRVDGAPLVPFVATDGGAAPAAVRCGPDGTVQLVRATTSKPPGVVLAWDVHRTTYEIRGSDAVDVGTEQVRDHTADPLLHEQMPELFEAGGLLDDCTR